MRKFIIAVALLGCIFVLNAREKTIDELVVRRIADRILEETKHGFISWPGREFYSKAEDIPEDVFVRYASEYIDWHYVNGVINIAMVDLGEYLDEQKYVNHAINMINLGLDNYRVFEERYDEEMPGYGYPYSQLIRMRELDDCGAIGASAVEVYKRTKDKQVRDYLEKVSDHILEKQDRLDDLTLVRKFPHEMTLWADDLYMSVPYLARMGDLTGEIKYFGDAVTQVLNFYDYLWNEDKGLYYHAYYADLERNGVAHWGRCNGWVMMANVHLMNLLPEDHPGREDIRSKLEKHILGIAKYQNGNGLWHQLLDKSDSYEESSCTSMFVYSIARAVNMGWIDKRYSSVALTGWEGLKEHMITHDGRLKNVCVGTGIQDNLVFYYNRPARLNEAHGLGAVIEAGIEILRLKEETASDGER